MYIYIYTSKVINWNSRCIVCNCRYVEQMAQDSTFCKKKGAVFIYDVAKFLLNKRESNVLFYLSCKEVSDNDKSNDNVKLHMNNKKQRIRFLIMQTTQSLLVNDIVKFHLKRKKRKSNVSRLFFMQISQPLLFNDI